MNDVSRAKNHFARSFLRKSGFGSTVEAKQILFLGLRRRRKLHSRLHSPRMRVSRVALLACVLLVAAAATFAADPCALPAVRGSAWFGSLDTYVFAIRIRIQPFCDFNRLLLSILNVIELAVLILHAFWSSHWCLVPQRSARTGRKFRSHQNEKKIFSDSSEPLRFRSVLDQVQRLP